MPDSAKLHRPKALKPGDLVGIAAPAGPFPRDRFEAGLRRLESLGLRTMVPRDIFRRDGYLAGSDRDRAAVFNRLAADEEVRAIVCARGGYGSMRILDLIDRNLFAARCKILIGFSDVTALLLDLYEHTSVATFHGPVVTSLAEADDATLGHLRRLLFGETAFPIELPPNKVIHPGRAEGPLLGGNLTMIVHMLAAGRLPDPAGAILFLEDTGEAPYRIDRMLVTLKQSGYLDRAAGLVFGHFQDCGPDDELSRALERGLADFRGPAASGLPIGHGETNLALPIGPRAVLDTRAGLLDVVEPYFDEQS
jgi:muramoyltetrapeptide carboxypeptidase